MNAVLILDNNNVSNLRMLVILKDKNLEKRVSSLLRENNEREAFEILRKSGLRKRLSDGRNSTIKTEITIFEKQIPAKK